MSASNTFPTDVVDDEPLSSWDLFVLRHTKPWNIRIHIVSCAMFWGGPLAALVFWSPYPLVFFALSGVVGWFAHAITKDSGVNLRQATSDPRTVFFATIVVGLHLLGRYPPHLARARARYARLGREEGMRDDVARLAPSSTNA